ncbi:MAG: hypothetical protein ACI4XL_03950 [Bacillus sp. (in: firmicutes)]
MGYEYAITKDGDSFTWKIGYKGDITIIEEGTDNKEELQDFMMAVGNSKTVLSQLIIWVSLFLIIAVISILLYKKNKKLLKDGAIVILLASGIALYIIMDASFDLNSALQEVKHHYLRLSK